MKGFSYLIIVICLFFYTLEVHAKGRFDYNLNDVEILKQIPLNWRACEQSIDCNFVDVNCENLIAVNKTYLLQAREKLEKNQHTPTGIRDCAPVPFGSYGAVCINNRCIMSTE